MPQRAASTGTDPPMPLPGAAAMPAAHAGAGRAATAVSAILALRDGGDHANGTAACAGREGMALLDWSRGCGLQAISHTL